MSKPLTTQGLVALLTVFTGLCTMFALIVTVSDGWREHAQESWPGVVATIEHCRVDQHIPLERGNRGLVWYVKCSINYLAGGSSIETSIRSRSTGSGWGGHLNLMRQWVAEHPPDSRMDVRYDPADPKTAILISTEMPDAGPRSSNNLKLLLIASVTCLCCVLIGRYQHSRSTP
jgi:hypothetical protein